MEESNQDKICDEKPSPATPKKVSRDEVQPDEEPEGSNPEVEQDLVEEVSRDCLTRKDPCHILNVIQIRFGAASLRT